MSGKQTDILRKQLLSALSGDQSHLDFASALKDFPTQLRGHKPAVAPHSAWQLLEHLRIAQRDILDFCLEGDNYHELKWPEEYWPATEAPADEASDDYREILRQYGRR